MGGLIWRATSSAHSKQVNRKEKLMGTSPHAGGETLFCQHSPKQTKWAWEVLVYSFWQHRKRCCCSYIFMHFYICPKKARCQADISISLQQQPADSSLFTIIRKTWFYPIKRFENWIFPVLWISTYWNQKAAASASYRVSAPSEEGRSGCGWNSQYDRPARKFGSSARQDFWRTSSFSLIAYTGPLV